MALAHGGFGLMVIGIVAITAWRQEAIIVMKPGETMRVAGYDVRFVGEATLQGANYSGEAGRFLVTSGPNEITTPVSEKRGFQPSNQPTTEVGLLQTVLGDLYVVMGDRLGGGRAMRIYFNPLVSFIWLGATIIFAGGIFSLTDRRYRVGVPKAARLVTAVPAE